MNRQRRSAGHRSGPDDFGLLVSAVTAPNRRCAVQLRALLTTWGIRATMAPAIVPRSAGPGGGYDVLVFGEDAHAAYLVLAAMLPDQRGTDMVEDVDGQ